MSRSQSFQDGQAVAAHHQVPAPAFALIVAVSIAVCLALLAWIGRDKLDTVKPSGAAAVSDFVKVPRGPH